MVCDAMRMNGVSIAGRPAVRLSVGWLSAAIVALGACGRQPPAVGIDPSADASRGARLIVRHGCGSCHRIPGITGAYGRVGPPLEHLHRQAYIAGVAPNRFDVMRRWLRAPEQLSPRTAMPNLGLSDDEARDIAAYLYTLR